MTTLPPPPPEAQLIASRRKARIPRLSMRQAAIDAGISPTSWAEIETARKKPAPGITVYRAGTPEMLAPMARTLGITADEMRAAGRADVADYLDAIAGTPALGERQKSRLSRLVQRDTLNS